MPVFVTAKTFAPVHTWLPPSGLSTCIRAVLMRNTLGVSLPEPERRAHYPASPICTINCLFEGRAELVTSDYARHEDAPRQRLSAMAVSGPHTQPQTVFYDMPAHGVMIIFYPDAWWALTGVSVNTITNQVVDARTVLPKPLLNACERMFDATNDEARISQFFEDVLLVWQQRKHTQNTWHLQDWPQAQAPWMEALAIRASNAGWGRSLRQYERRIKQWTGWSLRKLQGAVRGEAVFFAVMEAMNDGCVDWTQIALDHGFSDQSHFIRETRRITGFSPEALRHGMLNEEAFWSYRAWARLAGYELFK
jgi:AraC-like DNA-binding protein